MTYTGDLTQTGDFFLNRRGSFLHQIGKLIFFSFTRTPDMLACQTNLTMANTNIILVLSVVLPIKRIFKLYFELMVQKLSFTS